jgi:UDP-N-acetylmuramate--alanine ligase
MYNTNTHFHLTGIGGSGMSSIAEILLAHGFSVSGSDVKLSSVTERLQSLGATIFQGHSKEHLPSNASLLVYSSAVNHSNPELIEAASRSIPIIRRAEVLAELMRLKFGVAVGGSHGKTTTTSMLGTILEAAGLDPTIIVGGQIANKQSGARVGKGEFLVAESDESDRSFLLLRPTIAIVTNIDTEHLNAYENFSELENCFASFVNSVPFYGLSVMCIDDPKVRSLYSTYSKRKVSYGLSIDAQVRPDNIQHFKGGIQYDVLVDGKKFVSVKLPMPGTHLMLNSLAAIAVAKEFRVSPEVISSALGQFPGVHRRLEVSGVKNGVTVINDYGHHPTEIKATLNAIQTGWIQDSGKLHVIFQPHRYSRTKDCFVDFLTCFNQADTVTVTDIYAASESPIDGVNSESLVKALDHSSKQYISSLSEAAKSVVKFANRNDVVVCLGAGNIGSLPSEILNLL